VARLIHYRAKGNHMAKTQTAQEDQIMVAKESFFTRWDGEDRQFIAGMTRVRAGHPILVGREHLFEPIGAHYEVEQATNAPGERRGA